MGAYVLDRFFCLLYSGEAINSFILQSMLFLSPPEADTRKKKEQLRNWFLFFLSRQVRLWRIEKDAPDNLPTTPKFKQQVHNKNVTKTRNVYSSTVV